MQITLMSQHEFIYQKFNGKIPQLVAFSIIKTCFDFNLFIWHLVIVRKFAHVD